MSLQSSDWGASILNSSLNFKHLKAHQWPGASSRGLNASCVPFRLKILPDSIFFDKDGTGPPALFVHQLRMFDDKFKPRPTLIMS